VDVHSPAETGRPPILRTPMQQQPQQQQQGRLEEC